MAGYSSTPLIKKLGIQAGSRLLLVHAPSGFSVTLGELPDGVRVASTPGSHAADVIVAFFREARVLRNDFAKLARQLEPSGGLWIAWPKRAAKVPTDVDEKLVREVGLATGLVDNKVCAIDEIWSGLRFVVRLKDRPKRAPR